MKVAFRKSFVRDLKKVKDERVLYQVLQTIDQAEAARGRSELGDLKKMTGTKDCYRIRIGSYRLGVVIEEDTVEFVRCLNRRDLYRYFP
jgi:mRNA interferase RelE/StbE